MRIPLLALSTLSLTLAVGCGSGPCDDLKDCCDALAESSGSTTTCSYEDGASDDQCESALSVVQAFSSDLPAECTP